MPAQAVEDTAHFNSASRDRGYLPRESLLWAKFMKDAILNKHTQNRYSILKGQNINIKNIQEYIKMCTSIIGAESDTDGLMK